MKPQFSLPNTIHLRKVLRRIALLLALGVHAFAAAATRSPVWVLIDTQTLTLTVRSSQNQLLARFRNISIGSGGVSTLRRAGDSTTPLGIFHVVWVNHRSPYHLFFGLDYPNASYGKQAYELGLIGKTDYDAILAAKRSGGIPPQGTALGGGIGIHGIGRGDPRVQRRINWTDGCIALTNAEVERLATWIEPGTRVEIR